MARRCCIGVVVGVLGLAACEQKLPSASASSFSTAMKSVKSSSHYFASPLKEAAEAVARGDTAPLAALSPATLAAPGRDGMTLMWWAIGQGQPEAVRALVARGVDPDTQIAEGLGSALHYAFVSQDTRWLAAMLDGGLSPDHQGEGQLPMLQRAVMHGSFEHLRLLVARGANVNQRDSIGGTALDKAVSTLQPEQALFLVDHGADVHAAKTNGDSVAWGVHLLMQRQPEGSAQRRAFETLRERMVAQGVKWPPEPPPAWRARQQGAPAAGGGR